MNSAELKAESSVGELLTALARNTGTLVQKEVQLAATEMTAKANEAARDLGIIAAGGALMHIGVLVLAVALVVGLTPLVPFWLSSLIVGVLALGGGLLLVRQKAGALGRLDPVPERTVQTLQDDVLAVKEQLR